jgi:predicted RNA-binding Zn-ribbon protein involved in translation (DUF1610 family)
MHEQHMQRRPKMKPYPTIDISDVDYFEAVESYTGWCPDCGEFIRDNTEPDAEDYDCPTCLSKNVVGAEQALLLGYVNVIGEEE